jgi:hypothetical protein
MAHLRPCEACARHVRADETRCPFCEAELGEAPAAPGSPAGRLGRAALMAVGVTLGVGVAAATVTSISGCGGKPDPNHAKPYGAPPADGLLTPVV